MTTPFSLNPSPPRREPERVITYHALRVNEGESCVEMLLVKREMEAPGVCRRMTQDVVKTFPNTNPGLREAHAAILELNCA